jgi:hypothetical protein
MPTVRVDLPGYDGIALTLFILENGVTVNSGGDTLTEVGDSGSGHYTADVAETLDGTYSVRIRNASGQDLAIGEVDSQTLYVGRVNPVASSSVVLYPIQSTAIARVVGTTLTAYVDEAVAFTIMPTDSDGNAVDTTGLTLEVVIENRDKTDVTTIADGSITKGVTSYTFTSPAIANATVGQKFWSCRRTDNDNVISQGPYVVEYAATGD